MANVKNSAYPVALHDFSKGNGQEHAAFLTEGPSLTRQEFAEECDINTIMQRYDGYLSDPMRSMREPRYVDFADMPQDLMGFMRLQQEAADAFMTLPAQVRKEFENDPIQFVAFAADPGNLEQMREWGLAAPSKEQAAEREAIAGLATAKEPPPAPPSGEAAPLEKGAGKPA